MAAGEFPRKKDIPPELRAQYEASGIYPEETRAGKTAGFLIYLSTLSYGSAYLEATSNGISWRTLTGVAIGTIAAAGTVLNQREGNRTAIEEFNRRQADGGQIL